MTNESRKIRIYSFRDGSPLANLPPTTQNKYLTRYLSQLDAISVLEEPNYFDRDYLSEFTAFYARSTAGYPNVCRRLHFFARPGVTRDRLRSAASGNAKAQRQLNDCYLGFAVLRPIPAAPLGRTVLAWYRDREPETPRVNQAAREYRVHVAGVELSVHGLAWQQQDTGVGACATIGLWSMLHSSAFDDHHAIPTTAEITEAAHKAGSPGSRIYPSAGLKTEQICEAIKGQRLAPMEFFGDITYRLEGTSIERRGFRRETFSSYCASFLRSGYPILVIGQIADNLNAGHAVCAVGFRSCLPRTVSSGSFGMEDADIPRLYVHDDNLGPNVRFDILAQDENSPVYLQATHPSYVSEPPPDDPVLNHPTIKPWLLIVGTHEDVRLSASRLYDMSRLLAEQLAALVDTYYRVTTGNPGHGLTASSRYIKLADYMGDELGRQLKSQPRRLARVRLSLTENVPPMSLHLGLVRVGLDDATPLVDILFDTTDSERNSPAFAYIYYDDNMKTVMDVLSQKTPWDPGVPVKAC